MKEKRTGKLLVIALLVIFVASFAAGLVQSSFGQVVVHDVRLVTEEGEFAGYLLVPKTATTDTPAPAIVTSHGYLNNREMQDLNYVELSRRGFVVFAMDAYSHGHSSVPTGGDAEVRATGGMIRAVEYLDSLGFVDSSRIGVTGHSMGGGFAEATVAYYTKLEKAALEAGATPAEARALNKVAAGLIIGNLPGGLISAGSSMGAGGTGESEAPYLAEVGAIFGRYDEFGIAANGPLRNFFELELIKQMAAQQTGNDSLLLVSALEEGARYANDETGFGITFYSPYEIHPWNHFSRTSAGHAVDFFQSALGAPNPLPASNQIWWLKELLNAIALAGFFLLIVPLCDLFLRIPFFRPLRTKHPVEALQKPTSRRKYWVVSTIGALLPAILYIPLVAVGYLLLLNPILPQDTTGGIAVWSLGCGLVALLIVRIGRGKEKLPANLAGTRTSVGRILRTLLLALCVVSCALSTVFLTQYFFQTDFRIWSFAVRTFSAGKIWVALKYAPFFLVFYIANSLSVSRNRFADWSERKQILISILWNTAGIALLLLLQYLPLLFTGSTLLASIGASLGGTVGAIIGAGGALLPILLFPFIPILAIAATISVKLYRRTGSIYLGGLVNGLLIVMITVANTSFSFPY